MKPIRIFIADDHELIRQAIRDLLSQALHSPDILEASSATELLEMMKKSKSPDLVLLDLKMPYPTTPSQFIRQLKRRYPSVKVVVISSYSDPILLYTLIVKIGIEGYILKDDTNHELVTAIGQIIRGQEYYSHQIYPTVMELLNEKNPLHKLTQRKKEVLRLLNYKNAEIAKELNISVYTVRTHILEMRNQLELDSRFDLLRFAMKYNYIRDWDREL